jgi:ribonuclease III
VAILLYERCPDLSEGELSRLRAQLVQQESLHDAATRLELGEWLRLGEGELRSGGHRRPSILADALEALIGAIYLDAGFPAAKDAVARVLAGPLEAAIANPVAKDPKTTLQEILQGRKLALPRYVVSATEGEAHAQTFVVECRIEELGVSASGRGASRRAAEQDAASQALPLVATARAPRKRP